VRLNASIIEQGLEFFDGIRLKNNNKSKLRDKSERERERETLIMREIKIQRDSKKIEREIETFTILFENFGEAESHAQSLSLSFSEECPAETRRML
jgi:hypothetical protein